MLLQSDVQGLCENVVSILRRHQRERSIREAPVDIRHRRLATRFKRDGGVDCFHPLLLALALLQEVNGQLVGELVRMTGHCIGQLVAFVFRLAGDAELHLLGTLNKGIPGTA